MAAAPLGGSGASSKKLVGHDNFKNHNPRSDRFTMLDFDHVEFWTSDATNSARRFSSGFGMQMVAASDINNGNLKYASYCMQSDEIRFVFTAPYWTEAPNPPVEHIETFPHYDKDEAHRFIGKHGLAGRAIGIKVTDATDAYNKCLANGGVGVLAPLHLKDDNGEVVISEVTMYTDVVVRFVQGRDTYKGAFLPGYKDSGRPSVSYGLNRVDHVVSNCPELLAITEHLEKMLGLHEFAEFVAADIGTLDSGLNSMVMANNDETVLFPVNEPTFGTRRKSQIQSFIEHHQGPGIQHIALQTKDIIQTIKAMSAQTNFGGVEFQASPGATYYNEHVPKKMQGMVSQELIDECAKFNILIDRDSEGGLLQIFTKPLLDRPTLFIEVIQRLGCPLPDGRQKPACGGFGKGNFGALFKSIEDAEKIRDGEEVVNA